jgi:hypothetical protein
VAPGLGSSFTCVGEGRGSNLVEYELYGVLVMLAIQRLGGQGIADSPESHSQRRSLQDLISPLGPVVRDLHA